MKKMKAIVAGAALASALGVGVAAAPAVNAAPTAAPAPTVQPMDTKSVWSATRWCEFADSNATYAKVGVRWQLTYENGERRVTMFRWFPDKESTAQDIVSARIYETSAGGVVKGRGLKWDDKNGEESHIFWSTTTREMPWVNDKNIAIIYIHLRRGGAISTGPAECVYRHVI